MNVSKLESNLLDLVTAVVMAPVAALYGLAWLIWQGAVLLWPYRKYIGLALAIAGFVAVCWACPALPLGLAITAVVGWATMPRSPRGGWGLACGVSWNSVGA
jgi:hypothetical protein